MTNRPPCLYRDTDNHSDDLYETWIGGPEPIYLCGYHLYSHWPSGVKQ